MLPRAKIPTKPNRAPCPWQVTATDTAPKLQGKYLVKTRTTHCQWSKSLSNNYLFKNMREGGTGKYSIVFATTHNF